MGHRTHGAAAALIATVLACLVTACGGSDDFRRPAQVAPPDGSGYFVGVDAHGMGAAVDFHGSDPVADAARAQLARRPAQASAEPVAIGVAAIVNDGDEAAALPRFIAVMANGGAVPLSPARTAEIGLPHPRRLFPGSPLFVAPGAALTTYVVLRGVHPEEVDHLTMVVRQGEPTTLRAHRR